MNLNSSSSSERQLYDAVMKKDWDEVVKIFEEHPEIHGAKITKSEDTALHVAITQDAPEKIVEKLVDKILGTQNFLETLAAKNQRKDTPLHYAALSGSPNMCRIILRHELELLHASTWANDASLVGKRNKRGETPLFLAALNGDKPTFSYLYSVCLKMGITGLWRRKNGDTILHLTIQREYLDLSLLIMHLYKDQKIGSSINEEGMTPLHVLASIPSAFESGTQLSWWKRLCYNFINVKEPKFEPPVASHVVDIENSGMRLQNHQQLQVSEGITSRLRGYWCSIREIKQKHVWGDQIMKKLCEELSSYAYNENEIAPIEDLDNERKLQKMMNSREPENNNSSESENEYSRESENEYSRESENEYSSESENKYSNESENEKLPTALLTATKYGLVELVDGIINRVPVAIHDKMPTTERNIVLHAIHERQPRVLKSLMKHPLWLGLREAVDIGGNNALHLAAKLPGHLPWQIQGSAMQMQWEVKWFEFVKENMPAYLNSQQNKGVPNTPGEIFAKEHKELIELSNRWSEKIVAPAPEKEPNTPWEIFVKEHEELIQQSKNWLKDTASSYSIVAALTPEKKPNTPAEIFAEEHKELINKSNKWLKDTASSYSIVAALTAGVTYSTSYTVPGGNDDVTGKPKLQGEPAFTIFAYSGLISFCFSVTSLAAFLSVYSSRMQSKDFRKSLPLRLLLGLTSFFVSVAAMLVSFCAAHSFELNNRINHEAVNPWYSLTLIPLFLYAAAQIPLYWDLLRASFTKVPEPKHVGEDVPI